jgi:hypothetical protein
VWGYTPRQTQAFLSLAAERRQTQLGEMLAIQALAASGNADAIQRQLKQLSDEG